MKRFDMVLFEPIPVPVPIPLKPYAGGGKFGQYKMMQKKP